MHEDVEAAVALYVAAEVEGDVTCDASRVPSHINPQRIRLTHSLDTVKKVLHSGLSLGREIFEGVVRLHCLLFTGRVGRRVTPTLDAADFIANFHVFLTTLLRKFLVFISNVMMSAIKEHSQIYIILSLHDIII